MTKEDSSVRNCVMDVMERVSILLFFVQFDY